MRSVTCNNNFSKFHKIIAIIAPPRSKENDKELLYSRSSKPENRNDNRISLNHESFPHLREISLFCPLGCSLCLTHHAEGRGPVLRSQPVNSAVPRQCSAKRFTVVLRRVLSRAWTCLWTRARYPSSSFTNSVLSSRHLSRFSDTFHLSRPTTACCAWIDDLLTLVWQMLSPIINVASLGAMIHDAVGISRRECSSEGPRRAYFICGLILCAPPRNHLISCPASRAHARSSCHEILQLKMHLRSLHGRPTTRNSWNTYFSWLSFLFRK